MNYYPHHIGDYASATTHLSMLEDGAYRRLLEWYYLDEKPLPNDSRAIYRRVRASSEQDREAVDVVLEEFFQLTDDGYHHKRCDAEIKRSQTKSEERRKAANKSWIARKPTSVSEPHANASPADAIASKADAIGMHSQEPIANSQEPTEELKTTNLRLVVHDAEKPASVDPPKPPKPPDKSIPDCPAQAIVAMYHEVLPELPKVVRLTDARRSHLRARWREWALEERWDTADQGMDRWRALFSWARKSKFLMGQAKPQQGRRPFIADFDFLTAPGSHIKLFEGKYHEA